MIAPGQFVIDFDKAPPVSRNSDPVTSEIADLAHTASGKRAGDCLIVLAALKKCPGITSAELAEYMRPGDRDWRYTVARRLPDLMNQRPALAIQGAKRLCGLSDRPAVTWYPV
jgi:hypothetical protein